MQHRVGAPSRFAAPSRCMCCCMCCCVVLQHRVAASLCSVCCCVLLQRRVAACCCIVLLHVFLRVVAVSCCCVCHSVIVALLCRRVAVPSCCCLALLHVLLRHFAACVAASCCSVCCSMWCCIMVLRRVAASHPNPLYNKIHFSFVFFYFELFITWEKKASIFRNDSYSKLPSSI